MSQPQKDTTCLWNGDTLRYSLCHSLDVVLDELISPLFR